MNSLTKHCGTGDECNGRVTERPNLALMPHFLIAPMHGLHQPPLIRLQYASSNTAPSETICKRSEGQTPDTTRKKGLISLNSLLEPYLPRAIHSRF